MVAVSVDRLALRLSGVREADARRLAHLVAAELDARVAATGTAGLASAPRVAVTVAGPAGGQGGAVTGTDLSEVAGRIAEAVLRDLARRSV